jgi:hypothetical protein
MLGWQRVCNTLLESVIETPVMLVNVQRSRRAKVVEKNMVVVDENWVQRQFETQLYCRYKNKMVFTHWVQHQSKTELIT